MGSVRWAFPCGAWRPRRRQWLLAAQLVQPEEKERIGHFVFARDAKAALAGRLLMRKLIAEELGIPWNEVHLQRTPKGKPFLASNLPGINSNYNFNVSHQGDYAVLAAEPELQVGIDVMKTDLPGNSLCSSPFFLYSDTEVNTVVLVEQENILFRYCALKESFLKAIGVGIGFNLQRIEFNVSPLQLEIGKVVSLHSMWCLYREKEKSYLKAFHDFLCNLKKTSVVKIAIKVKFKGQADWQVVHSMEPNQLQFTLLTFEDLVASGIPVTPEDSAYWDNFCSKQEGPVRQSSHSR
ncbi:ADPPT transferase, partial [Prunella fulvescens]|nr:ADPPT transferase [Prunella fulvescens]